MSRRVEIGAAVFRVSRSGWDADTAPVEQLLFAEGFVGYSAGDKFDFHVPTAVRVSGQTVPNPTSRIFPLPYNGEVPMIFLLPVERSLIWDAVINAAGSALTITNRDPNNVHAGRCIVFRNRQF